MPAVGGTMAAMQFPFSDREAAGRLLGEAVVQALRQQRLEKQPTVVLALTRGGVPVGVQVARALGCSWEPLVVRKVAAPLQSELAVGAVADGDPPVTVMDRQTMTMCGVDEAWVQAHAQEQIPELLRRRKLFFGDRPRLSLRGQTAVVVDDGIATGATVRAAVQVVRARQAARVVVATPVAPAGVVSVLRAMVDGVVCLRTPENFAAVGWHYVRFPQVQDDEVCAAFKTVAEALP